MLTSKHVLSGVEGGAKSAKKELGISLAKHVLSKDEGAPRGKGKIVISNEERNLS